MKGNKVGYEMKIAQVCHRYYPSYGGIQNHVKNISEKLVKKGFEVEVLTTNPSKKLLKIEMINGVVIKRFRSWAPNKTYYLSRDMKNYLSDNSDDYEIIHAHNYHAFPALYAAQAKNKNRFIFSPHYHGRGHTFFTNILLKPYKFLGKRIFEKADKIVCVSNHEKKLIMNHFKIDNRKIEVIPNGVNLDEFKYLKRRIKNYRVLLYVGRLEKYKGVHYLIRALSKLEDQIILEIVGNGPYKRRLVNITETLGVDKRVKFYKGLPRKDLLQKYVNADLFISLSKLESYGISVAEALAAGTPCIVAKTSALSEWVDNKNCFGIDFPIDVNQLVSLITMIIGKKIEKVKLPDWDDVVKNLIKVYEINQSPY